MLISKFMTSQPGKQIISIHILSNITRSKNIHGIKFGQLMQYNMWNIFLEKSFTEYGGKCVTTPSSNKLYLWSNIIQLCTVCFCCMPSWRLSKYIETKLKTTCFYFIKSLLLKIKYCSCHVVLADETSLFCCPNFEWYWVDMYCFLIKLWSHKFWNWPIFQYRHFWPKNQEKNLNIFRTKRAFKMK